MEKGLIQADPHQHLKPEQKRRFGLKNTVQVI